MYSSGDGLLPNLKSNHSWVHRAVLCTPCWRRLGGFLSFNSPPPAPRNRRGFEELLLPWIPERGILSRKNVITQIGIQPGHCQGNYSSSRAKYQGSVSDPSGTDLRFCTPVQAPGPASHRLATSPAASFSSALSLTRPAPRCCDSKGLKRRWQTNFFK